MEAGDNNVTAKPVVTDGDLNLEVLDVTGALPKDAVQTALNELTKKLNDNYPLGIHADSVEVTDLASSESSPAKTPRSRKRMRTPASRGSSGAATPVRGQQR